MSQSVSDGRHEVAIHLWWVVVLFSFHFALDNLVSACRQTADLLSFLACASSFAAYLSILIRYLPGTTWYFKERHGGRGPRETRSPGRLDAMAILVLGILLNLVACSLRDARAFFVSIVVLLFFDVVWLGANTYVDLKTNYSEEKARNRVTFSWQFSLPEFQVTAVKWLANNFSTGIVIALLPCFGLAGDGLTITTGLLVAFGNTAVEIVSTGTNRGYL